MNHVAIYSLDCKRKLSEIRGSDASNTHVITAPDSVVQNDFDLCVVNCGTNVVCVSQTGAVRWIYDGTQARLLYSFYPLGICCDKHRNLLICDHFNSCIHYVDRDGVLIQLILKQEEIGMRGHWGIGLDKVSGVIWIGNFTRQVVLAKYIES